MIYLDPDDDLIWAFLGVAWFYQGQGQYKSAETYLYNCLEALQSRLGDNHPAVATSLNNLAELYHSQGRYEDAEPLYLQALQICEQSLGIAHPNTITVRGNYAGCLRRGR